MQISDLSFLRDTIYISPQIQKESLSFRVLAFLELLSATGTSCRPRNKYELKTSSPNCMTLSIFTKPQKTKTFPHCVTLSIFSKQQEAKTPYALSTSMKIIFYCLKILSIGLGLPYLIIELTRLYLRNSIENHLKFPLVIVDHKPYNAQEINDQIAVVYPQLLQQAPADGVIYPLKSSERLYHINSPSIISFELTRFPALTFKVGDTPPSSKQKSPLSKEIDTMKIIEKHLKNQKIIKHFHLPLAYIYNENEEDFNENFPCFILEEKSKELNLLSASTLWKNNEVKAIPVFIALARFLISSGFPYSNPTDFILNVSADNITMTLKPHKDFLPLHEQLAENQMYFLFQDLYTETCMDAIINEIIKETEELKGKSAATTLHNALQKIKEERIQMIKKE